MELILRNVQDYGQYYHGVVLHELQDNEGYRVGWYYDSKDNGHRVFKTLERAIGCYKNHEQQMIESGLLNPL